MTREQDNRAQAGLGPATSTGDQRPFMPRHGNAPKLSRR